MISRARNVVTLRVVGQLHARNQQHPVVFPGIPRRFPQRFLIGTEVATVHHQELRNRLSRSVDALTVEHMVGNRDHIEPGLSVEPDNFVKRVLPVTPRRVNMEIAVQPLLHGEFLIEGSKAER